VPQQRFDVVRQFIISFSLVILLLMNGMDYSHNISSLTTALSFGRVSVLLRRNFREQMIFVVFVKIVRPVNLINTNYIHPKEFWLWCTTGSVTRLQHAEHCLIF